MTGRMDDLFYTIKSPAVYEIKVKGSRFIGETELVRNPDEALGALEHIRKREHAATHHCFAYRIGAGSQMTCKYSDDGEPNGTAGRPIHDVLRGRGLTNTLVVVTRYYGGTKLGTGGLMKAYSEAARRGVEQSGLCEDFVTESVRI